MSVDRDQQDALHRSVVAEAGIAGVVTPSDVVQLPVRLLVFALIAHLEEVMRAAIREREPDDDRAIEQLAPDRLKLVRKTLKRQWKRDLNPAPLDVTQFIDKANLLFDLGRRRGPGRPRAGRRTLRVTQ